MPLLLCGALAMLCAGLLIYSQTWAFTWDEGFHLLTAQLIIAGKRPYLDFVFPQTPLNAYWNAMWMRLFGESWRVPHAVSALMVTGAVAMTAQFVLSRLPSAGWRLACALATVAAVGLNIAVVEYGTLGQAYGTCLFLTVAAFRLAVLAVQRKTSAPAAAAGLCAGAAAACSLLTAAVAPVLLLWIAICNQAGGRWKKAAAFVAAAAIPFLPVLWLLMQDPRPVLFNLFQYQLSARQLYWPGALENDLEVLTAWVDCGQALVLAAFAAAGLLFAFRSGWDRQLRRELALCGCLAAGIGAELAVAHPTFTRYFLLLVPFVGILAAVGLYGVASRLGLPKQPFWPAATLALLFALGLARSLHSRYTDLHTWPEYEAMARKVNEVTPPEGRLYANEPIYFLTRRTPPSGLEFYYSHRLNLPAAQTKMLHLLPEAEMNRQVMAGAYDTAFSCDDEEIEKLKFAELYGQHAEVEGCEIYWGKSATSGTPGNRQSK